MVTKQITWRVCGSNEVTFKKISSSSEIRGTRPGYCSHAFILQRLSRPTLCWSEIFKISHVRSHGTRKHDNTRIVIVCAGVPNIRGKTRNGRPFVGRHHIVKLRTSLEAKRANGIGNDRHRTTCTEWMMCVIRQTRRPQKPKWFVDRNFFLFFF